MSGPQSKRTSRPLGWTAGLLTLGVVTLASVRADDAPVVAAPAAVPFRVPTVVKSRILPEKEGPVYNLDSLRATALANNPAIAVARASYASAVAGRQGVDNLRVPTFLQPDLPYRRKQACLGVQAAEAGVRHAELQTVFGVQFAYVSYLFAREQDLVARDASGKLGDLSKSVRTAVGDKKIKTDLKESDALLLEGVQIFATGKLNETAAGSQRALSALRQAVGVTCDVPLNLKHQRLIEVSPVLDRQHLVALALANRPELAQTSLVAQVTDLEVQAQRSRRSLNVRTFASGADLHALPLPAGQYDVEYRPGAVGPEMPPFLSGKKADRVNRAAALASRACSVNESARGLFTLEVEQAFFRYEDALAKIGSLTRAAAKLRPTVETTLKKLTDSGFGEESKAALDDLLKFTQVYSMMRVQANEARYQALIALITLERATGAAFRADLSNANEVKDDR